MYPLDDHHPRIIIHVSCDGHRWLQMIRDHDTTLFDKPDLEEEEEDSHLWGKEEVKAARDVEQQEEVNPSEWVKVLAGSVMARAGVVKARVGVAKARAGVVKAKAVELMVKAVGMTMQVMAVMAGVWLEEMLKAGQSSKPVLVHLDSQLKSLRLVQAGS